MNTKLHVQSPAAFTTPLLAVFAVDANATVAKDAKPHPALLTANGAITKAAAAVLASRRVQGLRSARPSCSTRPPA